VDHPPKNSSALPVPDSELVEVIGLFSRVRIDDLLSQSMAEYNDAANLDGQPDAPNPSDEPGPMAHASDTIFESPHDRDIIMIDAPAPSGEAPSQLGLGQGKKAPSKREEKSRTIPRRKGADHTPRATTPHTTRTHHQAVWKTADHQNRLLCEVSAHGQSSLCREAPESESGRYEQDIFTSRFAFKRISGDKVGRLVSLMCLPLQTLTNQAFPAHHTLSLMPKIVLLPFWQDSLMIRIGDL
jgi:hypothetical protein